MSTIDRLHDIIEPLVADLGLTLFDLEFSGGALTVTIDRPDPVADAGAVDATAVDHARPGVDLADITRASRGISRALDDADPIPSAFTLEVSSPGLERPLRTTDHFRWAVGKTVHVKTVAGFAEGRRLQGTLVSADHHGIVVGGAGGSGADCAISYPEIEKARTVFVWGPEPKPTASRPKGASAAKRDAARNPPASTPPTSASGATLPRAKSVSEPPKHKKVTAS